MSENVEGARARTAGTTSGNSATAETRAKTPSQIASSGRQDSARRGNLLRVSLAMRKNAAKVGSPEPSRGPARASSQTSSRSRASSHAPACSRASSRASSQTYSCPRASSCSRTYPRAVVSTAVALELTVRNGVNHTGCDANAVAWELSVRTGVAKAYCISSCCNIGT